MRRCRCSTATSSWRAGRRRSPPVPPSPSAAGSRRRASSPTHVASASRSSRTSVRTIAYILAQPPTEHDRDHVLRLGFGTEASPPDRQRFIDRFGCQLIESYGFSEGTLSISRTPDTPPSALGIPADPSLDVAVVDPATGEECEPARFDESGRLLNAGDATGEIVSRNGLPSFEGYYNNPEAVAERLRDGWYWTGDLAFRDEAGFFYFAGRSADRIRVDSENFAAAPIENILARYPGILDGRRLPGARPADRRSGHGGRRAATEHEVRSRTTSVRGSSPNLTSGTKWAPRFLRVTAEIPLTANRKVHKPPLRQEAWITDDPIWWRPMGGARADTEPAKLRDVHPVRSRDDSR